LIFASVLAALAPLLLVASDAPPPLHFTGHNLGGEAADWTAPRGKLSVIVAVPPSCPGNVAGVLDGIALLLLRRKADVAAVVLGVDGITAGLAATCPPGIPLLAIKRGDLASSLPVPGLPLLVVVSRSGALARVEWLPPLGVNAEALARDLERYFTLPEAEGSTAAAPAAR
jgi:hypothetical protein